MMQPPAVDPLNPFNLAPIEQPRIEKAKTKAASILSQEGQASKPSSFKLPPRLHLISDTSMNMFLDHEKCRLPCFMLTQYPNPDFIGRSDVLEMIDSHLLSKDETQSGPRSPRFFALCGMGGIGKTDLAVQYAHSRRNKFSAVFWLEAGGVSQLASDFGRIATHLGLQTAEECGNLESSIEVAKAWLAQPGVSQDGTPNEWLLIFDNADNLDIITDYVPYQGNGSILVTSRDPFAKEHFFNNGTGKDLEPLSASDSATLLRKLITKTEQASSSDEESASKELATHLAGLPLAMTQMAGFIRRRHLSIREFVSIYANDARYAEIHNVSNPMQHNRYGYTLATAFSFEGLKPHALKLLQLLAFMNPDRIQEYIFINPEAKLRMGGRFWTASTFESARYELLSSSIIKRNIQKKELWIHRLVQAEIRTRMKEDERFSTFKEAISLLAGVWLTGDLCSQQVKRWAVCEELLPHIERFYQLHIEYAESWNHMEGDVEFPTLLNESAVYIPHLRLNHCSRPLTIFQVSS